MMYSVGYQTGRRGVVLLLMMIPLLLGGPVMTGQDSRTEEEMERYVYPDLVERGADPDAFLPAGWHLLDSAIGDLDGDGDPDLAFVIERDSAVSEQRRTLDGTFAIEGRPRILAICIAEREEGDYRLALQTPRLVLREKEGGVLGDPWNGMEIENQLLHVRFQGGSNMQWMVDYKFAWRARDRDWFLVGVTSTEVNANNGDSVTDEYDLVTWSARTSEANISQDGCRPCDDCQDCNAHADCPDCAEKVSRQPKLSTRKLKRDKPRRLSEFEPTLWEIEPGKRI